MSLLTERKYGIKHGSSSSELITVCLVFDMVVWKLKEYDVLHNAEYPY